MAPNFHPNKVCKGEKIGQTPSNFIFKMRTLLGLILASRPVCSLFFNAKPFGYWEIFLALNSIGIGIGRIAWSLQHNMLPPVGWSKFQAPLILELMTYVSGVPMESLIQVMSWTNAA